MDGVDLKENGLEFLKKYRYILIAVLAGLFLMLLPEADQPEPVSEVDTVLQESGLQESLTAILSKIDGAGKTEVLLTEAAGQQTFYQADEERSAGDSREELRRKTVLITGTDREETGLILRIDPPVYQGAIVVCQGADSAQVRLSVVEAVSNATGLSTDRITVLKMK